MPPYALKRFETGSTVSISKSGRYLS